ncbi:MAG: sel1 repeat family protein [Alphaproteobacteria bacterium]|nr:sel1 repeat family protein [Alphaproteobacteria bacterium]
MIRAFGIFGVVLGLAVSATAQEAPRETGAATDVKVPAQLTPLPRQFNIGNSGVAVPLPDISPQSIRTQTQLALEISRGVFGPRQPVDAAYGAYQRGFYLTALSLALPRAQADDGAAQTLVGELYANGLGVATNPAIASSWYALGDQNGDRAATFQLAMLYQAGLGVPQNRERAAELIAKAAAAGHLAAQYNLGLLHVEGRYVAPDLSRAAELFEIAAEAGLPEAQYDYGVLLLEGAGTNPDPATGARFIGLAAAAGNVEAAVEYATLIYLGRGVDKDPVLALAWYRRAAELGSAVAQNRLAKLLAAGEGANRDPVEAAMWRALARRQGILDPQLETLLGDLTEVQQALGEERARFWPLPPPGLGPAPGQTLR